VTEPQ
jgi:group II intron reverse transcriptase/maturase